MPHRDWKLPRTVLPSLRRSSTSCGTFYTKPPSRRQLRVNLHCQETKSGWPCCFHRLVVHKCLYTRWRLPRGKDLVADKFVFVFCRSKVNSFKATRVSFKVSWRSFRSCRLETRTSCRCSSIISSHIWTLKSERTRNNFINFTADSYDFTVFSSFDEKFYSKLSFADVSLRVMCTTSKWVLFKPLSVLLSFCFNFVPSGSMMMMSS